MDIDTFRGIVTAVLMALFVGLVIWVSARRRDADFAAAARLALDDDTAPEPPERR